MFAFTLTGSFLANPLLRAKYKEEASKQASGQLTAVTTISPCPFGYSRTDISMAIIITHGVVQDVFVRAGRINC